MQTFHDTLALTPKSGWLNNTTQASYTVAIVLHCNAVVYTLYVQGDQLLSSCIHIIDALNMCSTHRLTAVKIIVNNNKLIIEPGQRY